MIGEVIIVNVTLETEGRIRCEVIVDDTFQVVRHEIDLITIVPSSSVPQIISKRKSFGIGEHVQLICIVGTSKPIASIHWFINDISVPESYYVKINETISNESHLEFILQKVHLTSSGHFIVRCQSQTDAHFYPEVHNSMIQLGVWNQSIPVIIGLKEEYELGDLIEINCTIPEIVNRAVNHVEYSRLKSIQMIEWRLNHKPV
ncbi:hypothetical protein RDWZM_009687 [Blomia tropicalis]|uniref:Ig-like domain-containing protein n=1 Tax=Blomia tropicalis TaxID=40697 RepID=A0A9Q0RLJ4_BLOTA|nr:hypothetical protein RDWZM_009687 [Blomia tropicalis]